MEQSAIDRDVLLGLTVPGCALRQTLHVDEEDEHGDDYDDDNDGHEDAERCSKRVIQLWCGDVQPTIWQSCSDRP